MLENDHIKHVLDFSDGKSHVNNVGKISIIVVLILKTTSDESWNVWMRRFLTIECLGNIYKHTKRKKKRVVEKKQTLEIHFDQEI